MLAAGYFNGMGVDRIKTPIGRPFAAYDDSVGKVAIDSGDYTNLDSPDSPCSQA